MGLTSTVLNTNGGAGGVYKPVAVIVPSLEFPPTVPLTVQVTAVFVVPVTVAVNCCVAGARSDAEAGLTLILTVSAVCTSTLIAGVELAGPGAGFLTVTCTVPNSALVAVPVAVSLAEETNVVSSAVPPNMICAFLTNLLPVAVIVNVPTETSVGETAVSTGTGFSSATAASPVSEALPLLAAVTCTEVGVGRAAGAV